MWKCRFLLHWSNGQASENGLSRQTIPISRAQQRRITHKLYVDDSGTKEYANDRVYSARGQGKTPFFVYGGLLMPLSEELTLDRELRALKQRVFKTADRIEIKANWLRRQEERERRYLRKYSITDEQLASFVDDVYKLIVESDSRLLAAIVDKAAVQEKYKERAWYAPTIAYECLCQRAQIEMARIGSLVHVTVDTMDGATPGKNQYQDLLEKHHQSLHSGSRLQAGKKLDHLAGINFANSAHDERLQLADLVAYAVYRQFVDDPKTLRETGTATYGYLARLARRFCNDGSGKIAGYGIAIFP